MIVRPGTLNTANSSCPAHRSHSDKASTVLNLPNEEIAVVNEASVGCERESANTRAASVGFGAPDESDRARCSPSVVRNSSELMLQDGGVVR